MSFTPGSRVWLDARRTKAENKPSRAVHIAMEGISDLLSICQREGHQLPFQLGDLKKDMRKLAITKGDKAEYVCWWQNRTEEIIFGKSTKEAFQALGKDSDLEQIAAWCAVE